MDISSGLAMVGSSVVVVAGLTRVGMWVDVTRDARRRREAASRPKPLRRDMQQMPPVTGQHRAIKPAKPHVTRVNARPLPPATAPLDPATERFRSALAHKASALRATQVEVAALRAEVAGLRAELDMEQATRPPADPIVVALYSSPRSFAGLQQDLGLSTDVLLDRLRRLQWITDQVDRVEDPDIGVLYQLRRQRAALPTGTADRLLAAAFQI